MVCPLLSDHQIGSFAVPAGTAAVPKYAKDRRSARGSTPGVEDLEPVARPLPISCQLIGCAEARSALGANLVQKKSVSDTARVNRRSAGSCGIGSGYEQKVRVNGIDAQRIRRPDL